MLVRQLGARRLLAATAVALAAAAVSVPAGAAESQRGGTPGTGVRTAAAVEPEGLGVIVDERGRISRSVDGLGTLDGTGSVTVRKPAGGTVRKAVLLAASTGFDGPAAGEVTLAGTAVPLGHATDSSIGSVNYWTDVTALLKPALDAAPAGDTELAVTESDAYSVDGVVLAVVFSDPAQTRDRSTTLLFGTTQTTGDHFQLRLSKPIDPESPGALLDMSLGISYSYQSNGTQQFSQVDVNGSRLTTSAGGEDDGLPEDGALLTVGGIGDSTGNPIPDATPTEPRSDDELYDLRPFVAAGATTVDVDTLNPSDDDNIFFAEFTTDPPVTTILTPNPPVEQDLVSLGDGYSSGEGTGVYDSAAAARACHRGPAAWPRVLDSRSTEVVSIDHRACTGVAVADLTTNYKLSAPQLPTTPNLSTELVTLTVGAADVGLRGILGDCVGPSANCTAVPDSADFRNRLRVLAARLDALYPKIEQAYPNARIAHVGYPRLTPPVGVTQTRCAGLSVAEQAAAVRVVDLLDATVQAATDRRARVEYADTSTALAGHELCTAAPWVAPITPSLDTEQGHPTVPGHAAIAARVATHFGITLAP